MENVAPTAARKTGPMHMQPTTTILLINSPHLNWERLRALLAKQRHAQVVGEVHRHDEAVRVAAAEQPDVIIAGSDIPSVPIIALVQELRTASPTSRIVVVGKLLDSVFHIQLTDLGIRGFLLWKDVTEETLWPLLETVQHDVCVGSTAAVERRGATDRRRGPQASAIVVGLVEQAVITGLGTGLTQREIACQERVSETTIERMIATLRGKFGVATTNALCGQAGRLGFLD